MRADQLARGNGAVRTAQLDRLERTGFIERRRDHADRRKVVIVPAPAGPGPIADIFADLDRWARDYLDGDDEEALHLVLGFVTDLNGESARRTAQLTDTAPEVAGPADPPA